MTRASVLLLLGLLVAACTAGAPQPLTVPSEAMEACQERTELPPDVQPPQPLRTPQPQVPPGGGSGSGFACIEVTIDTEGRVRDPEVVATDDTAFAISLSRTVRNWRYEPATRDGEPVEVRTVLFSNFQRR